MDKGTAGARLRKLLLFEFAKRLGLADCARCGKPIETIDDFTIDHLKAWLHVDPKLFWDLSNIGFAHEHCNKSTKRHAGGAKFGIENHTFGKASQLRKVGPPGMAWCQTHQDFLPEDEFNKTVRRWNGLAPICRVCLEKKRT